MAHRMSNTPEYRAYQMAKHRCTNPKSQRWDSHGGRGIRFLFISFRTFYDTLGPRPSADYSLERIDNNGHYEPDNVKWATRSEQQSNKRPYSYFSKRHGRGYSWHKASGKWMARIKYMGQASYLGLFKTEEAASAAYSEQLDALRNEYEQQRTCRVGSVGERITAGICTGSDNDLEVGNACV